MREWGAPTLALAAAHLVPSVAAVGGLRRRLLPGLCGRSGTDHVALTFDDGPDPRSTPRVLEVLDNLRLRATFFLVGERLAEHRGTARLIVERGHELAVHGWTHRPDLLRAPSALYTDLRRATQAVEQVSGTAVRFWRPPHGIPTGAGLLAARRLSLRPVLWTADGRDWSRDATADSIHLGISTGLDAGGVILLHDTDRYCAPGSWRAVLGALPAVANDCLARGWIVGPLRDHGLAVHCGGSHAPR